MAEFGTLPGCVTVTPMLDGLAAVEYVDREGAATVFLLMPEHARELAGELISAADRLDDQKAAS